MKYPKLRNGPSPVGEALHRALQRSGAPFLNAEGVGYSAHKYGNGAEVNSGLEDGYYCLGSLEPNPDNPPFKILGSNNARGVFLDRGTWGGDAFTTPSIAYAGNGIGVVPKTISSGDSQLLSTKFGKVFKSLVEFTWGQDGNSGFGFLVNSPARQKIGTVTAWNWGAGFAYYVAGTLWSASGNYLYTKDSGKTWQVSSVSYGVGWFHGLPNIFRLNPKQCLMVVPTYTDPGGGNWNAQHDPKLTAFAIVDDYGDTINQIVAGDVLNTLIVHDSSPVTSGYTTVNPLIQSWIRDMHAIPLVDGSILYLAEAQYYDGRYAGGASEDGMYVFSGAITGGSNFVSKIKIPGINTLYAYPIQFNGMPIAVAVPSTNTDFVYLAVGNATGTTWTYKPMPHTRSCTGTVTAIDKNTLICPMYDVTDAAYILMQTTDKGDTWTRRAVIKRDAPAPDITDTLLARFDEVAYLRKNGLAAQSFPGAPWMGDDSIPLPWV